MLGNKAAWHLEYMYVFFVFLLQPSICFILIQLHSYVNQLLYDDPVPGKGKVFRPKIQMLELQSCDEVEELVCHMLRQDYV